MIDLSEGTEVYTTVGEKLVRFASIMNECGPESPEANGFLERYRSDGEFTELAELSRRIKLEWSPRPEGSLRIAGSR